MTKNERSLISAAKKVMAKADRLAELVKKSGTKEGERAVEGYNKVCYDLQEAHSKVEAA